nr:hypothetical protein CFP56_71747 [Quercus suber]
MICQAPRDTVVLDGEPKVSCLRQGSSLDWPASNTSAPVVKRSTSKHNHFELDRLLSGGNRAAPNHWVRSIQILRVARRIWPVGCSAARAEGGTLVS